jgi:hypothetical protein
MNLIGILTFLYSALMLINEQTSKFCVSKIKNMQKIGFQLTISLELREQINVGNKLEPKVSQKCS